jgi:hypothetical protein
MKNNYFFCSTLSEFEDLEPLRGLSNKKTLYSTRSCVNWAFFGTCGPHFTRVLKWPTRAKKGPIYTETRQINYYILKFCNQILRAYSQWT